ncbi:MAG: sugar phosphate isomerase/epimerase [Candidatus Hinthialibacter antarcticus]|nr:sugar phosphate isomerase/epimerase [Candidatus Hinthialibacter antarcticus]
MTHTLKRRNFIQTGIVSAGAVALGANYALAAKPKRKLKLGFDNFSIRALNWDADQILDYANTLGVDCVLYSDLDVLKSHEDAYLKALKAKADQYGIQLYAGTGGVCPSSGRFIKKWGSADDHLSLLIRVAERLGSPVARCYLGSGQDRTEGGGIQHHIEVLAKTLQSVRTKALDAGVTFAVENHAGDMQSHELKQLIELAGKDFVGATLDSGNAAWTLEDPQTNLKILAPYAACSGIRDNSIWEYEDGAKVVWASPGDGDMDWDKYLATWLERCPDTPFVLEIINWIDNPREYAYLKPEFWKGYEDVPAEYFARFVAMAKKGKPYSHPADRPKGERSDALMQQQQKYDLERSLAFCNKLLAV